MQELIDIVDYLARKEKQPFLQNGSLIFECTRCIPIDDDDVTYLINNLHQEEPIENIYSSVSTALENIDEKDVNTNTVAYEYNEFEEYRYTIEDIMDQNNDTNIVVDSEEQVMVNDDDVQEIIEYKEKITTNNDDLIE